MTPDGTDNVFVISAGRTNDLRLYASVSHNRSAQSDPCRDDRRNSSEVAHTAFFREMGSGSTHSHELAG
jgi:hypothetical protein